MNTRHHLLGAALAATLAAIAAPVMAQDTPPDTIEDADASSATFDRLVERYSTLLGSPESAAAMITALREGGDFSVTTTTTVDDPDDADGDGELVETTTTTTTVANTVGPMGWGEVNGALAIAGKLVADDTYATFESALLGTPETTDADGNVMAGTAGILQMRTDGMGWGEIANELGFSLGSVIGNGEDRRALEADVAARGQANASHPTGRPDSAGQRDRAERPERMERPQRPERVERPERPQRPERPERPTRP